MAQDLGQTGDDPDGLLMLEILARTPLDLDGLRLELAKQSVFADTDQLRTALQWRTEVQEFPDGVWAHVPTLADEVVLTHRLTAEELEIGVVAADGDLDLWADLADEGVAFDSGGELRTRWAGHPGPMPSGAMTGLVGPEGWLAGHQPDDLVGLRLRAGVLHLEPVELADAEAAEQTLPPLLTEAAAAAQRALRDYLQEGDPIPDVPTLTPPYPDASGAYDPGASREGWVAFELPLEYATATVRFLPYRADDDPRFFTYAAS